MKMAKNGEIKVDLEHKGVDPMIYTMEKISKQMILTVLIAALLVGSSLLVVSGIEPIWYGMSVWAWVGFSLAFILFVMMLPTLRYHRPNEEED